jgi:hypothetical protein
MAPPVSLCAGDQLAKEDPFALFTDELVETIVCETEAKSSTGLDQLGPTELLLLATVMMTNVEKYPDTDPYVLRLLREATRLIDRTSAKYEIEP